jgi:vancomycin resistance protein YoaR
MLLASGICSLVLLVGLVAADYVVNAGRIYRGVEVAGLPLGGASPEEAERVLERRPPEGGIRLVGGPERTPAVISAGELGTDLDVGETVRRAYAVGREGNALEQAAGRVRATLFSVPVRPAVEYRREAARERVGELAAALDREPADASVRLDGDRVRLTEAREGYRLDTAATLAGVEDAVGEMRGEAEVVGRAIEPRVSTEAAEAVAERARRAVSGPVVLRAGEREWSLSPEEIGAALVLEPGGGGVRLDAGKLRAPLAEIAASVRREPTDAEVYSEGGEARVRGAVEGRRLDEGRLLDMLRSGLFGGGGGGGGSRAFEVPMAPLPVAVSTEEAEALLPTRMLGSYTTNYLTYDDSPGRVYNLQISSEAVNGKVVAPGEVFSFGEYTSMLSYEEAYVINEGQVQTEAGGGLCQVASTLYMAANEAGLEIVERYPHSAQLPYIRPGFDATVWYDASGHGKDMKFRNDTDGYLLIKESVDVETGDVHAEVWGVSTGREVTVRSEQAPDGSWVTYRKVVEDGKVKEDGVLNTSVYGTLG